MTAHVTKIENCIGQPRNSPVWPYRIESHGHMGHGFIHTELQRQHRRTDQIKVFGQHLAIECQRTRIVVALVARKLRPQPDDAILTTVGAYCLRRLVHQFG